MREAARIAVNRTVAGVHFPIDSVAGQVLGLTLGRYFIQRAQGGTQFDAWRFDGERYPGTHDFDFHNLFYAGSERADPNADPAYVDLIPSQPPGKSLILEWLWSEAANEWT